MDLTPAEKFLEYAYGIGAIKLSRKGYELSSGRISPHYFDIGPFCTGDDLSFLARAYAEPIKTKNFGEIVIFGPAYKGISLSAIITMTLGGKVSYTYNRKEAKDHGEGGLTVGAQLQGKRVLIVDDTITTGGSASDVAEIVLLRGGTLIGCFIAFDRKERPGNGILSAVQEFEKKYKIPVYTVATLADLISFLKTKATGSYHKSIPVGEMIGKIRAYQSEYGVK